MDKREDAFLALRRLLYAALGLAALLSLILGVHRLIQSRRTLTGRVFADGEFTMGASTPWGMGADELTGQLRWVTSDRQLETMHQRTGRAVASALEDGGLEFVPFEAQVWRDCALTLMPFYRMNREGRLVSGGFFTEDLEAATVRAEAARLVQALDALPVSGETPTPEILAVLEDEASDAGHWVWRAGGTRLEMIFRAHHSSLPGPERVATLEIRIYGPDA